MPPDEARLADGVDVSGGDAVGGLERDVLENDALGNGLEPDPEYDPEHEPEHGVPEPDDHADDADDYGDEYDEYEDDEYRPRPFWARTSTLVVFVVALLVLSGAVTAWLRISDLQERVHTLEAQALAGESARQAAVVLAQDLATYDYRDLGGNFRRVAAAATPRFAAQLRDLTRELGAELRQTRAVSQATVRTAGVVSADGDKVVVAVFVDQTVTNTRSPQPRVERSRMELTLLRQGGVWRLDQAGEL